MVKTDRVSYIMGIDIMKKCFRGVYLMVLSLCFEYALHLQSTKNCIFSLFETSQKLINAFLSFKNPFS